MLTEEENRTITQVGPGTPMGELWRRYWLPALLPDELPGPDCDPIRVRLLGEDLVAFRDTNGQVGLVTAFCPHRRAPMFFGRNEEAGLRCVYHGWKFDVNGTCVDMPSEPAESNFKDKVQLKAYAAREQGGVIWVYMGPKELTPELPQFEWTFLPPEKRTVSKWFARANWLQGMEGDIDTAHVNYLHSQIGGRPQEVNTAAAPGSKPRSMRVRPEGRLDRAPRLMVLENNVGFSYGGRRNVPDDKYYWRVTQWMAPMYSLIPSYTWPRTCDGWVPVDDHHTMRIAVGFHAYEELDVHDHPGTPVVRGSYTFPDGGVMDTYLPTQTKENLYGLDRQKQKTGSYTGIEVIPTQDRAMTEGMGPICDRTEEHLGTSDIAVIAARRRLLKMAADLQNGIEPFGASHGEIYRVRSVDIISPIDTLETLMAQHHDEALAPR